MKRLLIILLVSGLFASNFASKSVSVPYDFLVTSYASAYFWEASGVKQVFHENIEGKSLVTVYVEGANYKANLMSVHVTIYTSLSRGFHLMLNKHFPEMQKQWTGFYIQIKDYETDELYKTEVITDKVRELL